MEEQEEEIQVTVSGYEILIERPHRQQVGPRIKPATGRQEDQFERMLEVMREWKNDIIVSMDIGQQVRRI